MKKEIYFDYYFTYPSEFNHACNINKTVKKWLEQYGLKETLEEAQSYFNSYKICEVETYRINGDFIFVEEIGTDYFKKEKVIDATLFRTKQQCLEHVQGIANTFANEIKRAYQETLDKIEIKIIDK